MSVTERILELLRPRRPHDATSTPDPTADQAVLDLLALAMLVDGTSSEAERDRIREVVEGVSWPAGSSAEAYYDTAVARVRSAMADATALDALLRSVRDRLPTEADRERALALVGELAGLDGSLDDREAELIDGLRARFEGT